MIIIVARDLTEVRNAVTDYTGKPDYREITASGSEKYAQERLVEETTDTPLAIEVISGDTWDEARGYYLVSLPFDACLPGI